MSQNVAPRGAMVGVMPLKVMGPPCTMVMMPTPMLVLSATEGATTVTCVAGLVLFFCDGVMAVGRLEGAM